MTTDEKIKEHEEACAKTLELTYVRKRPALSISVVISILVVTTGALAYYYSSESRQNERHFVTETRCAIYGDRLETVEQKTEKLEKQIMTNQEQIIQEIRALRKK